EALWQAAKTAGIPVICNATPEPAVGRDLAMSADVLIVNEVEAIELLGEPVDSEGWPAVANALRLAGPEIVVITLGAQGALVSMAQETVSIPSLRVEVIDTTGAGDAFCGAFSAALARGATPGEAARTGVVAGALAVTKAGAQPSMPRRAEIEHALNTIDR
ncbi:MAG: PfkB family carbohydrate kinase, partial [Thermomicrobiales bacterium]